MDPRASKHNFEMISENSSEDASESGSSSLGEENKSEENSDCLTSMLLDNEEKHQETAKEEELKVHLSTNLNLPSET